ncbi:cysteine desulfurase [Streptacidiphilus sp. PB12-B1b]|uniref:cysteine desulfurase family protein n=1 Tax=Streptacidiphilus sp. PB12-B1b TaxID=2705012 RepID=UPI0015FA00A2|nr:cysteine desulfurase family protein [Streptacidiphilus sp. PB12-B1b]QMU78991.1 cysteine desulfurase [Streptacidiphilus sp. PB12-B1b]
MPYLDHAATTPMLPEAVLAMTAHLGGTGNASSLHAAGRRARRVIEESRETLAQALGARPSEVVLTGGGTESDNLAVKGLYWARRDADPARVRILCSPVEHHAVLDAVEWLERHEGARIDWLPVDRLGRVHPEALRDAVAANPDDIALITVMWANNEVGTVQPILELSAIAREFGIPIHADAVQAFGQLPLSFADSGLDALTVTGHKIGGPYGIGALVLSRAAAPVPLLHGGGQERDVRSGTLDVPAAAGFAAAAEIAVQRRPEYAPRVAALRDTLVAGVLAAVPDAVFNGDPGTEPGGRLPAGAHFSFPGCEGDALLMLLDARGIECSTGSACSAGVPQPSHVLLAMGVEPALARASLRFSLGHTSTGADVAALLEAIGPVVERARMAGAAAARR